MERTAAYLQKMKSIKDNGTPATQRYTNLFFKIKQNSRCHSNEDANKIAPLAASPHKFKGCLDSEVEAFVFPKIGKIL